MKNIVVLHSSKRKVNTYGILEQMASILEGNDCSVEIISLYDMQISDCIGCERCIIKDKCVLNDQTKEVMDKIALADGVIISSPVYLLQVSGKLKTFIDRTCAWYHRPLLVGKPVLSVATTKGSGLKDTLAYLDKVCAQWGGMSAGQVGRNIRTINNPVTLAELSRFITLLNNPKCYKPTVSELIGYEVQKSLAVFLGGLDSEYWSDKGWLSKPYYVDCKVRLRKRIISSSIGKAMRKGMAKKSPTMMENDSMKQEN